MRDGNDENSVLKLAENDSERESFYKAFLMNLINVGKL